MQSFGNARYMHLWLLRRSLVYDVFWKYHAAELLEAEDRRGFSELTARKGLRSM